MAVTPQPIPERLYVFEPATAAVADQVNHELDTVYAVLQGGIGDQHIADQANINGTKLAAATVPSLVFVNNAALIPVVGGPITAGAIAMQITIATLLLTPGATNNQYGVWTTPFTTLLSTSATIQSGATYSSLTGTPGSSTTQGHAAAYNPGGLTETIIVHVMGIGIL